MMLGTKLTILVLALFASLSSAQWLVGTDGTRGGNGRGRNCVFPFIYKGQSYNECITTDNGAVPWCATSSNYDTLKQWGRCSITIPASRTRRGNAGKSSCFFPFTYMQRTYQNCTAFRNPTNKPWCSTSANMDRDNRWGQCVRYQIVKTTGGNVPAGTKCNFPFWYRSQRYHGCINLRNRGVGWCATTDVYEKEKQWGNCVVETLKSKSDACPDGNTYSRANRTHTFGGDPRNRNTEEGCKEECDKQADCIGFDQDYNPGVNPRCYIHTDAENFKKKETEDVVGVDQFTLIERCTTEPDSGGSGDTETGKPVTTRGGNAGPTSRCVFPYRYKGVPHTSCTSRYWYTPWCGTTANYDRDGRWGECDNVPTE